MPDQPKNILLILSDQQRMDSIGAYMVGHHKLIDKEPYPYDDIQRIPLIVAGPGISRGHVADEFVYLHDLTSTIVEWGGATSFPCAYAQSLRPILEGKTLPVPCDDVYMTRHHHPFAYEQRWVRTRRFKYGFNAFDTAELYDLEADPDEMHNLITEPTYQKIKDEMIGRMWQHILALKDPVAPCFSTWALRRRPTAQELGRSR